MLRHRKYYQNGQKDHYDWWGGVMVVPQVMCGLIHACQNVHKSAVRLLTQCSVQKMVVQTRPQPLLSSESVTLGFISWYNGANSLSKSRIVCLCNVAQPKMCLTCFKFIYCVTAWLFLEFSLQMVQLMTAALHTGQVMSSSAGGMWVISSFCSCLSTECCIISGSWECQSNNNCGNSTGEQTQIRMCACTKVLR